MTDPVKHAEDLAAIDDDIERLLASPIVSRDQRKSHERSTSERMTAATKLLDPRTVAMMDSPLRSKNRGLWREPARPHDTSSSTKQTTQSPLATTPDEQKTKRLSTSSKLQLFNIDDLSDDDDDEKETTYFSTAASSLGTESADDTQTQSDSDIAKHDLSATLKSMSITAKKLPGNHLKLNDIFSTGSDDESVYSPIKTPRQQERISYQMSTPQTRGSPASLAYTTPASQYQSTPQPGSVRFPIELFDTPREKTPEISDSDSELDESKQKSRSRFDDSDEDEDSDEFTPKTSVKALLADQYQRRDGRTDAERSHALFSNRKHHVPISTVKKSHVRQPVFETPSKPPTTSTFARPGPSTTLGTTVKPTASGVPIMTPINLSQIGKHKRVPPMREQPAPSTVNRPHPATTFKEKLGNPLELHPPNSPFWTKKTLTTSLLNPEVFTTGTPEKQTDDTPKFRTTPFGTPNRTTSRLGQNIKRDTEKDIRDLLACIVDEDGKELSVEKIEEPAGLAVTLLDHQKLGVAWMKRQEQGQYKGGILADDMGLGKTVQSIALILAHPASDRDRKTTLIVAPLAVIRQWEAECKSKAEKGYLSVYVHHGPRRISDPKRLQSFDVVVTTYNTVASEFPRDLNGKMADETIRRALEKSDQVGPLFRTQWYRVILDEAQNIKNRSTRSALGCRHLDAQKRWCLSGTPIQNNLDELFSLFYFLHHPMFPDHATFKAKITSCLATDYDRTMKRLQVILKAIMLRRTKNSRVNGKPLLSLPERIVKHIEVSFSKRERELYNKLEAKMQRNVKDMYREGQQRSTFAVMVTALLRLRQACNHISLIDQALLSEKDKQSLATTRKDKDDTADDLADAGMGDLMDAFQSMAMEQSRLCVVCFEPLENDDQTHCEDCAAQFQMKANDASIQDEASAKVRQMIRELQKTRDEDPTIKTIVFSQFTSMLDLVEKPLRKHGFKYVRYDGSMRNNQREEALEKIREDPETTVMLVSLLCGSTGLNLVCASRVILLDVWWNPAIEEQAIDRVHRIGQKRPVHVTKITVADTVEKRIVALQEKKRALAQGALGENAALAVGKLSIDDFMFLFQVDRTTP